MADGNAIVIDTIVTHSPGLVVGDMDGEKVMLNIERGKYFALDSIASRIWVIMEKPCTVKDLVSLLVREYDISDEVCLDDVLNFLNTLYSQGLVTIA